MFKKINSQTHTHQNVGAYSAYSLDSNHHFKLMQKWFHIWTSNLSDLNSKASCMWQITTQLMHTIRHQLRNDCLTCTASSQTDKFCMTCKENADIPWMWWLWKYLRVNLCRPFQQKWLILMNIPTSVVDILIYNDICMKLSKTWIDSERFRMV